ncbi:pilin [Pseudomonas stutzeri]|nr:pilin [Stutzerimonas stutzeri]
MAGAKTTVIENAANGSAFASGFNGRATTNCAAPAISDVGVITLATTERAGNFTLTMTPNPTLAVGIPPATAVTWSCTSAAESHKFAPAECRNATPVTPPAAPPAAPPAG